MPSTGEKVKFRPFLVKEQKLLLIAQESEDDQQIMETMQKLVSDCTFGKVDALASPLFDIEYVFLKLRSKSVGEDVEIMVPVPDSEDFVPTKLNLDEVDVLQNSDHSNEIQLTDDVKIIKSYPTIKDMHRFEGDDETAQTFDLISSCISQIHHGDEIHYRTDVSNKEMNDFVDSLTVENLDALGVFFQTMPQLSHMVKVKHPKTKKNVEVELTGLQSFFV